MSRLLESAAVALALGLSASPAAAIAVPSCANSTVPLCIRLVASDGTVGSAVGEFTVIVRDLANNPWPNANVTVDVSNAADLRLCAVQPDPDLVLNCEGRSASKLTDANGVVTFRLLGYSQGPPTALQHAGRIYANGAQCSPLTISAFDLDGASGLGANDLSTWLTDFGTGQPYGRSDYDCSGSLGANDLALWFAAFASGAQTVSCGSSCP